METNGNITSEAGPAVSDGQPSLQMSCSAGILPAWLVATASMSTLAWIVFPMASPRLTVSPIILYWLLLTLGMIGQAGSLLWLVQREKGSLTWQAFREQFQVNPAITPEQFRSALFRTARSIPWQSQGGPVSFGPMVDPGALTQSVAH